MSENHLEEKLLLVVVLSCIGSGELHTTVDESGCPPWTYRPNSTSSCQCGSTVYTWSYIVDTAQKCLCVTYTNGLVLLDTAFTPASST